MVKRFTLKTHEEGKKVQQLMWCKRRRSPW